MLQGSGFSFMIEGGEKEGAGCNLIVISPCQKVNYWHSLMITYQTQASPRVLINWITAFTYGGQ